MKINIIGLGPGEIDLASLSAYKKITDNNKKYVRTEHHPTIKFFNEKKIEYKSYDYLYELNENFEDIYIDISNDLIANVEKYKEINYFVPGNPMIAEKSVELLIEKCEEYGIEYKIISGMSFIEPIIELVERDPINGLKIIDGANYKNTLIDINSDIIITQTYNKRILIDIKLSLSEIYGDEYLIYYIRNAGIEEKEKLLKIPIYELDKMKDVDHLTSLYIPKVNKEENALFDFNDLEDIMNILRGPNGCPWDIKQTHKSLRKHIIEETYELVNAIDLMDVENIIEELGDVLFQVIFHTNIAKNAGEFNTIEVTSNLAKKLIRRHPHVFSKNKVVKSGEVLYNWDRIKDSQRNYKNLNEKLLSETKGLPSLLKSYKAQDIASQVGFDWDDIDGVHEKIKEEYSELLCAIKSKEENKIEEELGDLLFSVVNLARFLNVDPDVALNRTYNKFILRLEKIENFLNEDNLSFEEVTLDRLNKLWNLAKIND